MRKVYFQIILSVLKSSGYNKEYESLSGYKDYKDSYTVLHYFDEDDLYFTIKFGNTLDALMDNIDYKADIDEFCNIQFREISFPNLIENKDTDIYENELRNYIHEYCLRYNKMGAKNQYNSINDDNIIQLTYLLKKNEEEIYEDWYNQNLELIDDEKSSDYVVSEIMNIMKSNVAYSIINEYYLNKYNNSL
ncbi:hypothetical protein H8356DRAFT_1278086 [Neocallimastix lanati (nom. inval.)]|uniref:Uncharacterized protein n=1 Tax=Neocallimastix californiae TaxID=1754190 RepID=A0A1Y2AJ59_9FUNG|nr:hypothetical protein H8356DRAFT_1278086 [Neocallimastix sp. JGI-2020a]ORY21965.1 hypothetical protein LY90DRAFT_515788 [Neocallimastix californiae]|eukprot:ORY21965.1 hypothetical protein LY90DRAFT_515788 [Neocallimastix californiae]